MTENKRIVDVIEYLIANKMIRNQQDFVERIGSDKATISQIKTGKIRVPDNMFAKIAVAFPMISEEWLITGKGVRLNINISNPTDIIYIPLLPIAAQGGSLNDFIVSVKDSDCERIISPIKGADFAITVAGGSLSPEYPNGAQILIKKIDEKAFIDWGKVYVLDTCNGSAIKILAPSEREGYVKCFSINPDPKYASFEIAFEYIYGIYRVMLCYVCRLNEFSQ